MAIYVASNNQKYLPYCKEADILTLFQPNFGFLDRFPQKSPISNFMEIYADGRT